MCLNAGLEQMYESLPPPHTPKDATVSESLFSRGTAPPYSFARIIVRASLVARSRAGGATVAARERAGAAHGVCGGRPKRDDGGTVNSRVRPTSYRGYDARRGRPASVVSRTRLWTDITWRRRVGPDPKSLCGRPLRREVRACAAAGGRCENSRGSSSEIFFSSRGEIRLPPVADATARTRTKAAGKRPAGRPRRLYF